MSESALKKARAWRARSATASSFLSRVYSVESISLINAAEKALEAAYVAGYRAALPERKKI